MPRHASSSAADANARHQVAEELLLPRRVVAQHAHRHQAEDREGRSNPLQAHRAPASSARRASQLARTSIAIEPRAVHRVRHVDIQLRLVGFLADLFVVHVRRDADDAEPLDVVAESETNAAIDRAFARPEPSARAAWLISATLASGSQRLLVGERTALDERQVDRVEQRRA